MFLGKIKESWTFKKYHRKIKLFLASKFYNHSKHLPEGVDRVYHVHIRKSAGTSINSAFWGLGGYNLSTVKREPIVLSKNYAFVRNNKTLIEGGDYFYASSHFEYWGLKLKPNTFTFTMLRDPYERLISLYKYYNWVNQIDEVTGVKLDSSFTVLKEQTHLLGNSFKDFINNLSDKYLYAQLYMFSKELNVEIALNAIEELDRIYFKDNFKASVENLKTTLNFPGLEFKNERRFENVIFSISEEDKAYAIVLLQKEIEFYNKVKIKFMNDAF